MNVVIPVFEGCVSASVVGMMDILMLTRNFYQQLPKHKKDWFDVKLISLEKSKTINNNGFQIVCNEVLANCKQADLVIVPAIVGDLPQLLAKHKSFIAWMTKMHKTGALLCSTCNGAFFVAATGYLDKKEATTSWFAAGQFKALFPAVKLLDERILVDNGKTITGGATLSFQNLCVYLIEKFYGKEIGNYAAKYFLVEKGKTSQLSYSIFSSQKNHSDEDIIEVQHYIEKNAAEKLVVSKLAEQSAMAERTFIRRFKSATGNTPSEYIQRVKIELAKKLLEQDRVTIKNICYETGYEDQGYFRNVFKKYTGLTPLDYKKSFTFAVA